MSKRTKKWLSLFMTFIMIMVSVPIPEMKVHAAGSGVWIGNTELEYDTPVNGTVKGSAVLTKEGGNNVLTFEDFEGVSEYKEYNSSVASLIFIEKDTVFKGKAKLEAAGETNSAICIANASVTVDKDAELVCSSGHYTIYNYGTSLLEVYGSVEAVTGGATHRAAIKMYEMKCYDGCSVNASAANVWSDAIDSESLVIAGGTVTAVADNEDSTAITGKSITIKGGVINASAAGKDGCAIGGIYTDHIDIKDGDITAAGDKYAIHADQDITVDAQMIFVEPADAKVSADKKDIVNEGGQTVKSLKLIMPETYGLWLGSVQVNSENKDDIPGILGGGKASYDPETKTLTFSGDVTGIEDIGTGKAFIASQESLTVQGDAVFTQDGADYGIKAEGTGSDLTIDGNIEIKANKAVECTDGPVILNGSIKASTQYTGWHSKGLIIEGGDLDIEVSFANSRAMDIEGDLILNGGSMKLNNKSVGGSALTLRCKNAVINSGVFSVSNLGSNVRVINTDVGAGFTVNGGVVEVVSKASDSEGLCADYLNVNGGSLYVEATNKNAIWCDKMEISNGTVKAKSDDTAVKISYDYNMIGGVLEAESTADKAVYAAGGITLTDVSIIEPEGGNISTDKKTIVGSDGTTEAKKVRLEGSTGYSVWVGSTEVNESNKDDIPGVTGGSASYDPVTNTLTLTGDVTAVDGLCEKGSRKYQIYSEGYLTVIGNATLRNTDADCAIYSNGKIHLKGNFDVYGSKMGVAGFKGISINGRLDAECKGNAAVMVNTGDITVAGEGVFAKNTGTDEPSFALMSSSKIVLKSGVIDAESPVAAICAMTDIQIPAGYEVTLPEDGKIGPVSGICAVTEADGTTFAKHARIEKLTRYDVWVGETRVSSVNQDDIPGVTGGKASYDPDSRTLTFTGDVSGVTGLNAHDAFDAQIFSKNDLTIAGDVKLENDAAMYGIYTKGKLTVDGNVSAKGKSHGVFAENSDLVVNGGVTALSEEKIGLEAKDITVEDGTLIAKGENSAIDAGSITVDGGSVSANVSGLLTLSKAMKISGDVELKSGSITVTNAGNDESDGLMAGGKVTVGGGKMKIAKSGVGGAALHAGGGVYVEDGELDIFCDDNGEHYTSRGIEESFISIKNDGKVNIETKGITSKAISDTTGYDINIDGGSLNVSCESIAVICSKFVLFDGDVNIEAANTALDCALLIVHEGKLEAWNKAEEGTGAIKSQYEIDLGAEVAVLEPAGGKLSDDKTTVVDSEGKAANKVKLATPAKYKLWVGSTQVTEANRDDIPGINGGGKASYDPESKTLIFSGDVKGVTGVDAAKEAQIYAAQDLTISGNAILTDDTAKYGILVESNDLTIKGDVEACGTISAIYASKDITVDGNVSVDGNCTDGVLSSYEGNIILNSGSITVNTDSSSMGAVMAEDIVLNSGSFTAAHKNGAAVIADRITVNGGEVSVSGKKGLDASHIIINGGNSTVSGNDVAVSAVYEFDMKGGNLKAASETGRAISAASVKISDKLMITEPEGGKISSDGTTIVDSADADAKSVTIERKAGPYPDEEADVWNLFEANENSFEISGITAGSEVANTNTKSAKFYTAKLNGNTISVELNPNADRKKAAKQSNCVLEFRLESGETVEYLMPVQYVKPVFKLSTSSVVIKNGAATDVRTQLLYKTKAGNFEPYDLSSADVSYGSIAATGDDEGYISFSASSSMSGTKLIIKEEDWEKAVELKFSVKATEKDVLNVDLTGKKIVILNTNVPDQKYSFDVILNGQKLAGPEGVKVSCKADGIASINAAGKLEIALPATAPKAGNYTVKLESGKAKVSVKVKVSSKALDSAITMKIRSKYDVVTRQNMVVEPVFKDAGMSIDDVTTDTPDITAELNDAGNIEITYTGSSLNSKNLKIGDIVLKLTLDGVSDPVSVSLKNVKARKSTPKAKASVVNISANAAGVIKGSVNIVSTVKDGSGKLHLIAPVSVEIAGQKKATAEINAADMTEIDIKSIDAKSGSIKLKLTYPGEVTRNVTVKIKKK